MKKSIALSFIFICAFAAVSFATPPQELELSYDPEAEELSIEVKHPVKDRDDHYIRKYVITKNQEEPKVYYRQWQESPLEFTEVIELAATSGDKIHVKLYCVDGGNKEAEIIVQKPADKADESAESAEPMVETSSPTATMESKGSGY